MVENSMTPLQVIIASTSNVVRLLHLGDDLGTLEVGKFADVLSNIGKIAAPAKV
jgi:imidazolonepropionase-like amidohydrolase